MTAILTAMPTISSDFQRTLANKNAFLDQQERPVKAIHRVWKPKEKQRK